MQFFYLRVANLPDYFDDEDYMRFFNKLVPNFKSSKMIPITVRKDQSTLSSGNVLVQTKDMTTIDKLLALHGRKVSGYPLSCWLMGHEHLETDDFNAEFDPSIFA